MTDANNRSAGEERFAQLPKMCFVFRADAMPGKYVAALRRGESGYCETTYDERDPDKALRLVQFMNKRLGVTEAQAGCMETGAAFGFHVPAANPLHKAWAVADMEMARAEPFVDDGAFYVQAPLAERQSGAGLLFRRTRRAGPSVCEGVCIGAYAPCGEGRWTADIAQQWDAESQTDALRLGVFATRNEAVMALWENRQRASSFGERANNYERAEAWAHVVHYARQKEPVEFGSLAEGRAFCGKVLLADDSFVVQSSGHNGAVIHNTAALSRRPAVDEIMTVKYDQYGKGMVAERQAAALER